MRRQERRRKFNEAVINCLYPPRPSQVEEEEDPKSFSPAELKVDCFPDDSGDAGSPSLSESDGEAVGRERKMTRAQRKRIRKKKLREESIRRGKMIGPLLSVDEDEPAKTQKDETKNSHRNAQVDYAYFDPQGDEAASTRQRRLKHRRMAKRLAKDGLASSNRTEDEGNSHID